MPGQNSKLGKRYSANRPSAIILPRAKSLSVQNLKTWKDAVELASLAENPNRAPLMDVFRSITRDLHLKADIQTRMLKIMGSKFKIVDAAGKENPDLQKLFKSQWFNRFLFHAMKAKFWGASVIELWDLDPETGELKTTNSIPPENVLFQQGIIVKEVGDEKGYPYKEGVYLPFYVQVGTNNDLGLLEDVAPDALAKKYAKAAWLEFCEKYGIAPRWVTTDSYSDTRHKELAEMMAAMVNNHWAVLQGTEKIETMQVNGGNAKAIFDNLIQRMNSEMSKGILGQDGTTNSNENAGTYGSLRVMQDVADDRHNADKTDISYLVNDELIWRLVEISPVYKGLANYRFEWDESKEMTPEELVETVVKLSSAGYQVDMAYLTEQTGIPVSLIEKAIEKTEDPTPPEGEKKKPSSKGLHAFVSEEITAFYPRPTPGPSQREGGIMGIDLDSYSKLIEKIAADLHKGKMQPTDLNQKLIRQIHSDLSGATAKGYGSSFHNYNKNGVQKLELEQNVFKFSAAKTYQEQGRLNFLLKDEKGNRRSFADFKKEAAKMNLEFNQHHLKTETKTFQRAAAQAKKWSKYEDQKHLYPNLQYKTAADSRVREEHAGLRNVVKPVDDPFWDKWYPPNGWNCRCYTVQTSEAADKGTPEGNPTMGFHNNPGKSNKPMDEDHPYYIFPKSAEKPIRKGFEEMKLEMPLYREVYKKGNAKLEASVFADKKDFSDNMETGKIAVRETGVGMKIRPHVDPRVLKKTSNAEYEVFEKLADLKSDFKKNNYSGIKNGFNSAKKQGCRIVVFDFTKAFKKLDVQKAYRKLDGTMSHKNNDFDAVIVRYNEKAVYVERKDFLEGKAMDKLKKLKTDQ